MAIKDMIDQVLRKPMNRKDFLAHSGAALLAVIGVSAILKSFNVHDNPGQANGSSADSTSGSRQTRGGVAYGASSYGGHRG